MGRREHRIHAANRRAGAGPARMAVFALVAAPEKHHADQTEDDEGQCETGQSQNDHADGRMAEQEKRHR